jgi:general secretion pathway protein L
MGALNTAVAAVVDEVTAMVEPLLKSKRKRPAVSYVERGGEYELYRNGRRGPSRIGGGSIADLGKVKVPREARSRPVEVRLDGSRVLGKVLQLPAASRNYLDAIVTNQVERMTPWAADRVVFDYAPLEAEAGGEQIPVRLVATSRDVLAGTLANLARGGMKPALVGTSEDPLDQPSAVDLLQAGRLERRKALRRRVGVALAAVLVVGVAASALSGWRLYQANRQLAAVNTELDAVRAEIERARASSESAEGYQRLVALRRESVPMVLLLDKISEVVPTSTYLTELNVDGDEVRITGHTSEAPALIEILEASDMLSDVRFAAPTIRGEGGTQDQFQILASLAAAEPATE